MFIYLCEKSRICIFWQKRLFLQAEEKGFEPLRRCYRPTGVRSQTLQPLGYSSKKYQLLHYTLKIVFWVVVGGNFLFLFCSPSSKPPGNFLSA